VAGVRRAFLVATLFGLSAARAHAATVMIVRPAAPSPPETETVSRLHGELLSEGLEVELAARPTSAAGNGSGARTWLERVAFERDIDAAIDVLSGVTPAAVDVWIFEREPRRSQVTRVTAETDADNAAERLAIRSVDVLRSLLIEGRLGRAVGPARRGAAVPPPPPAPPAPAAPPTPLAPLAGDGEKSSPRSPAGRLGLELGVAVLGSLDGVGPAVSPIARVGWAAGSRLAVQAELSGLGSRPEVATSGASARIGQQHALLGVCACVPSATRRLRPMFALSAGALRTSVDGEADAPLQAHADTRTSFVLQASVGARLGSARGYELALAAHAQIAYPYVAIHLLDRLVATSGRPNLLLTFTVGAWL
jgi:hypothetical protein